MTPMIFPSYIPVTRNVDGKALEQRLRDKGLEDAQLRIVVDALKEEGLIPDKADNSKAGLFVMMGILLALLIGLLGVVFAMQMGQ